jgi:hypothetical protein
VAELWEPIAGVFWKSVPLMPSWVSLSNFFESPFFISLMGALAGAYFGAWAAQRNAANNKFRDELLREIRSSNRGVMLGLSIINVALAMKRQHISPLKCSYDEDLERLKQYKNAPAPRGVLQVSPMLMRLQGMSSPVASLNQLLLDQSSGKANRAIMALIEAIDNLNATINLRNSFLDNIKNGDFPKGFKFEDLYFGLAVDGNVNNEYGDTVKAIFLYCDDVVFFALKTCEYLQSHGERCSSRYKRLSREEIRICSVDMRAASEAGLLPDEKNYESWLAGHSESNDTATT